MLEVNPVAMVWLWQHELSLPVEFRRVVMTLQI
jgi:hypothetical protein